MITRRVLAAWLALLTALIAAVTVAAAPAQAAAPVGFWLQNKKSNLCLDASTSQGVRLNSCNSGVYQRWYSDPVYGQLYNGTGKCLDASTSQGVRLLDCNGGQYQDWVPRPDNNSSYRRYASTLCLDGSTSQGVRLVECNNGDYQAWLKVIQP